MGPDRVIVVQRNLFNVAEFYYSFLNFQYFFVCLRRYIELLFILACFPEWVFLIMCAGRNLPRFTESNTTVQQWVRTHFGGRSTTPQPNSAANSGSTLSSTTAGTTLAINGASAHAHVANAEREGRYTKANSPICDYRSRNKVATLPSQVCCLLFNIQCTSGLFFLLWNIFFYF